MMTRPHTHTRRRSRKQRRARARTRTRTRTRKTTRGGTGRHVARRILSNIHNSPTLRNSPHIFSATSVPFLHEFGEKFKQKLDDPIEMISAADTAFSNAHTAMKNKELHDRAHAHDRDRIHLPSEFTPKRPQRILNTMERVQIMSKTPGISTTLEFPPPPSMNDEKTRSVLSSPTFHRSLAPMLNGPETTSIIQKLDFDDDDYDDDEDD